MKYKIKLTQKSLEILEEDLLKNGMSILDLIKFSNEYRKINKNACYNFFNQKEISIKSYQNIYDNLIRLKFRVNSIKYEKIPVTNP